MLQVDVTELRSATSWTWSATSPNHASSLTHTVEASPAELGALHSLHLSGDAHLPPATIAWARETLLGDELAEALESAGAATINLQGPYQAQLAALSLSAGLAPHVALSYRCGTTTDRVLPEHPRILYAGISPIDQPPLDLLTDRDNYIDAWSRVDCAIHTLVGHVS
ncbi:MAG: hypothetical protein OXF04_06915 [bacterium]|nr:hypothetical protein [bacterium]MCY4271836.1 hypothetical protein [bacterium]